MAKVARSIVEEVIGEKLTGEPLDPRAKLIKPDTRRQDAVASGKSGQAGEERQRWGAEQDLKVANRSEKQLQPDVTNHELGNNSKISISVSHWQIINYGNIGGILYVSFHRPLELLAIGGILSATL